MIIDPLKIPSMGKSKEIWANLWNSQAIKPQLMLLCFQLHYPFVLPHEKLSLNKMNSDDVEIDLSDEVVNNAIGFVLPGDEDDLFADIANDYDLEENDFFGNLGGMELENEVVHDNLSIDMSKMGLSDGPVSNGLVHYGPPSGVGTVAGEHPYGEHPSRTLFVRNINSNVEDSELRNLFEQYGDIGTLYTACKHRGFVMISYYDIRDARAAMKGLQNKPLRRKKLDIHYSIPKDNPSEKDINQGTLVVFNLDQSVSNEDLHQIFGQYGEVKEIRETPHKKLRKVIEYFDVRAAEAALRALNRSDIAGTRRNLMLQLNQELEYEESRFPDHVGSSITNLHPGNWLPFSPGEDNSTHTLTQSLGFRTMSPSARNHQPGLASLLHTQASTSPKLGPIGKDLRKGSHLELNLGGENSGTTSSFGSSSSNGSTIETLSGPQFLWGGPKTYSDNSKTSDWLKPTHSVGYQHGYPYSSHHHVLERQFGFFPESLGASFIGRSGLRGVNAGPTNSNSPSFRMMSSPRLSRVVINNGPYRRDKRSANQISKKQFRLELEKIASGEDTRTTLMIKNIPNKYTSKMLLAAIDENHKGTYDFLYLPIDFKNKCNVGYAFINMLSPSHIIPFYEVFNGKKWEKFNSEKVSSLAYARIQGRNALVAHFQNSSVMNVDKRCRPILFHAENSDVSDQIIQEHLPSTMNLQIRQSNGSDPTESFETSQKDDS